MSKNVIGPDVWAVEIHGLHERGGLAFDLSDLLEALGPRAAGLDWIVTDYDPNVGTRGDDQEIATFADAVHAAQTGRPRSGVRVSGAELRARGDKVRQTIDGQFIGVPPNTTASLPELVDLRAFPTSDAALVIKAVDSLFWIVITKSPDDVAAIRKRFRDVREADRTLELGFQIGP
jgi:hypothetical protein